MVGIYKCRLKEEIILNIKADNEEEAQNWLQTHTIQDVCNLNCIIYDECIEGEVDDKSLIDISINKEDTVW